MMTHINSQVSFSNDARSGKSRMCLSFRSLTSVFVRGNRKKLQEEEEAKERLRNQTTLVSL